MTLLKNDQCAPITDRMKSTLIILVPSTCPIILISFTLQPFSPVTPVRHHCSPDYSYTFLHLPLASC